MRYKLIFVEEDFILFMWLTLKPWSDVSWINVKLWRRLFEDVVFFIMVIHFLWYDCEKQARNYPENFYLVPVMKNRRHVDLLPCIAYHSMTFDILWDENKTLDAILLIRTKPKYGYNRVVMSCYCIYCHILTASWRAFCVILMLSLSCQWLSLRCPSIAPFLSMLLLKAFPFCKG